MTANLIPAAQYLRMSTEHQQYSLENQSAAIQAFAESHGFQIVQTYSDAARSGVALKRRTGLGQLLQDVVSGKAAYRAILVYDVSRWGRFQDIDESAHYEFVCKTAGAPVYYCAETFLNDGSLPSLIMKALKRTMAGEYSRELGIKVLAGQKRLALLGFRQGGLPGYGLQRMLVSPDRQPKQRLASGERKSLASDRVILVPGPAKEVEIVREIYRMFTERKLSVYAIAGKLNREGIEYRKNSKWSNDAVHEILSQPKYTGCYVYGRTSHKLYTPAVKLPQSAWIVTPKAFEPIIDDTTFTQAQRILQGRTINKSDERLLDDLRALLVRERRLSLALIKDSNDVASPSTYRDRFGSIRRAYELIGYGRPEQFGPIDLRRRTQALREQLITRIAEMFPNDVTIVRGGGRSRSQLRMRTGRIVTVVVARSSKVYRNTVRWHVDPVRNERNYVTLLARLDNENKSVLDFYVLPNVNHARRFRIREDDPWLHRGLCLENLAAFCTVVRSVDVSTTNV